MIKSRGESFFDKIKIPLNGGQNIQTHEMQLKVIIYWVMSCTPK